MQAFLDFAPLLVFLAAYYLKGFYAATAALMVAMVLVLVVDWIVKRRIPAMHGVSAALVLVFGAATLLLQDQRFIQWKPTVFFWAISVALLASRWIGNQPLVQRLLAPALGAETQLPPATWHKVNYAWAVFYALLGVLNLAVAWNASEKVWVNFKVFGLTALTFVFIAVQIPWLLKQSR